jgi:hypothetical protein
MSLPRDRLRKDNVKGQACLGCKRNDLGEKPQNPDLGLLSSWNIKGALTGNFYLHIVFVHYPIVLARLMLDLLPSLYRTKTY